MFVSIPETICLFLVPKSIDVHRCYRFWLGFNVYQFVEVRMIQLDKHSLNDSATSHQLVTSDC